MNFFSFSFPLRENNRYPSLLLVVPFRNTVKFTVIKILKLIVVVVVARLGPGSLCPGYNRGME